MKTDKKEGEVSTFDVCKAYMMVYFFNHTLILLIFKSDKLNDRKPS